MSREEGKPVETKEHAGYIRVGTELHLYKSADALREAMIALKMSGNWSEFCWIEKTVIHG